MGVLALTTKRQQFKIKIQRNKFRCVYINGSVCYLHGNLCKCNIFPHKLHKYIDIYIFIYVVFRNVLGPHWPCRVVSCRIGWHSKRMRSNEMEIERFECVTRRLKRLRHTRRNPCRLGSVRSTIVIHSFHFGVMFASENNRKQNVQTIF